MKGACPWYPTIASSPRSSRSTWKSSPHAPPRAERTTKGSALWAWPRPFECFSEGSARSAVAITLLRRPVSITSTRRRGRSPPLRGRLGTPSPRPSAACSSDQYSYSPELDWNFQPLSTPQTQGHRAHCCRPLHPTGTHRGANLRIRGSYRPVESRELNPASRWTLAYHSRKAFTRSRTLIRGGVVAALSRLT